MYSKLLVFLLVVLSLGFFFYDSGANYIKHSEIKHSIVNHPEFIPSSASVHLSSGGFDSIISDFYWLSAVQYIGSNAIGAEYKQYLYVMLDLVTDLNPHFTYPYEIGELLLPTSNERYENFSETEVKKNVEQGYKIWLKGMMKNCDISKIERIKKENILQKLWTEPTYKNPCSDSMIPYYLGYISYWNMHDAQKASEFYRIASANEDTPKGARTMAAIMQWKTGDREKAIIMFLSLAESVEWSKRSACAGVSKELGSILIGAFSNKASINGKFLAQVEQVRKGIVRKLKEESVDPTNNGNIDNFCSVYLNKAVREMNVGYLETADARYFIDKKTHALAPETLFANKYIDYIPLDFQRDSKQGTVYYYNPEINAWDYKMGN